MAISICRCGYAVEVACSRVIFNPRVYKDNIACKKKFNLLFKLYKQKKLQNGTSGYDRHECRFYNSMDYWWHTNGIVMKDVTASANESTYRMAATKFQMESKEDDNKVEDDGSLTPEAVRKQFFFLQNNIYGTFSKMAENSTTMVNHFVIMYASES